MNQKELDELMEKMIVEEKAIMDRKGPDYTNDNLDRMANFKEIAEEYGVSPLLVLGIYLSKHLSSIRKYCTGKKLTGEGIRSKIADSRNYLVFLRGFVEEIEQEQSEDHKPLSPYNSL